MTALMKLFIVGGFYRHTAHFPSNSSIYPPSILESVVFPTPDFPTREINSPCSISRLWRPAVRPASHTAYRCAAPPSALQCRPGCRLPVPSPFSVRVAGPFSSADVQSLTASSEKRTASQPLFLCRPDPPDILPGDLNPWRPLRALGAKGCFGRSRTLSVSPASSTMPPYRIIILLLSSGQAQIMGDDQEMQSRVPG